MIIEHSNMVFNLKLLALAAGVFVLRIDTVAGNRNCSSQIYPVQKRPCPDDLRDDGTSCWRDSYGRGDGRVPDKASCAEGLRDDGTSCWIDSYGRGVGRAADKSPCPPGLRDDGTSCWSDAHIYGKGCCCTLWGCCNKCPSGYRDDGCTCRKTDIGIKVTLMERLSCREDEDKYGTLCYPKCDDGYHSVGCCVCEPDGGPGIVQNLSERQSCHSDEEQNGGLCYPKCREGYESVGCCICQPIGGPGIEVTLNERQYCSGTAIKFNGVCIDSSLCSVEELTAEFSQRIPTPLTSEQTEQLQQILSATMVSD